MYRTYRILTYVINVIIFLGLLIQFLVILFDNNKEQYGLIDFVVGIILFYAILTSFYFILKTKTIYKVNLIEDSGVIDIGFINNNVTRFRFDKEVSISNVILAGLLIIYCFYSLIFDSIKEFYGEELVRFLFILFAIFYGLIQIFYSMKILKLINKIHPC